MHYMLTIVLTENEYEDMFDVISKKMEKYDENLVVEPYIYRTEKEIVEDLRDNIKTCFESRKYKEYLESVKEGNASPSDINFFSEREKMLHWGDEDLYIYALNNFIGPEMIDERGNELSDYNPNSKWDYYDFDGRFKNSFLKKDGTYSNCVQVKDFDFKIDEEKYQAALNVYDFLIGKEKEDCKTDLEKEIYLDWHHFKNDYIQRRFSNKEEFAEEVAYTFSTYALLTNDDVWMEEGFEYDPIKRCELQKKFRKELIEYVKNLDESYYLVSVDCHI